MRILFTIGIGILPEQRIKRWVMVSQLYAKLSKSLISLGHQVYFYVHPEAYHEDIPSHLAWICEDHAHLHHLLSVFSPDYVFCWNGSSPGDVITTTIVESSGAKMVYSEQGWFPQLSTIYFDFSGCNGRCGTKNTHHPKTSEKNLAYFNKRRGEYLRSTGIASWEKQESYHAIPVDVSLPVFVPLQDERDLNIVLDSPFKTMNDFVSFISSRYPESKFIVRPHPKFPNPKLEKYSNVIVDNCKIPMFHALSSCGMVMGINSTTLLESALIGYAVVSFGESLATGTGLFYDIKPGDAAPPIEDIRIDEDLALGTLFHLLCQKQFYRDSLDNPSSVMESHFFREMRSLINWNGPYR